MPEGSLEERVTPPPTVPPAPSGPAGGHRPRSTAALWAAAGIGAGAVAPAWSLTGSAGEEPFTLVGEVQVAGDSGASGACGGDHEFGDLDKGALVTVFDSAGRVVATGSLGSGAYDSSARRVFPVAVRGVPDGSASYSVKVGWHARTKLTNEAARTGALVVSFGRP
ncbi:hypothetical protein ACH4S8_16935 [Streptomyces sp. NPDC021080]|uniref:hypothetical protein n=1 Tax=Streptomyces sp. NPDC021080 TaxID=3365110 RepID=UPI0037BA5BB9